MKNTIIINGRQYDATTGEPVAMPGVNTPPARPKMMQDIIAPAKTMRPEVAKRSAARAVQHRPAQSVHRATDKSHTLARVATKRPTPQTKSHLIRKFATQPVSAALTPTAEPVSRLQHHPIVATRTIAPPAPAAKLTPRELKEELIKKQLDNIDTSKPHTEHHHKKRGLKHLLSSKPRALHVSAACLALLLLGGYFAYLNMPSLSVRVAASRAGVSASYPEYQPDGYSFDGPIAYSPGEVRLKFSSNSANHGYQITQRTSNWDSRAVLDNYVLPKSESYLTYQEQGLTIYTFANQAAWVNSGVLYTLDGNAPLSSEQVLKIAASL